MGPVQPEETHAPFGAALEPALREACGGRLSAVRWFRTEWQRGGAATGHATYDGEAVVVKLPVPPRERDTLLRLQGVDEPVVPGLRAHGEELGGYDIAWVVMQQLSHGPVSEGWGGEGVDMVIDAAVRFQAAAAGRGPIGTPRDRDWVQVYERACRMTSDSAFPHAKAWKKLLKEVEGRLHEWLRVWGDRPREDQVHGDLHPANVLCAGPNAPAVLIDPALTQPGHWVQDAVYFEHLFWHRREALFGRKVCPQMARLRRERGLPTDDWQALAEVKRRLLALEAPARYALVPQMAPLVEAMKVLTR